MLNVSEESRDIEFTSHKNRQTNQGIKRVRVKTHR
jgi:hypothetical protein